MKYGSEVYNLLIDVRQWIAMGKPACDEKRFCEKLDKLIFELGKIEQAPTEEQQAAQDGIDSANGVMRNFLKKSES